MNKEFDKHLELQLQEYEYSGSPDEGLAAGIRGNCNYRPGLRPAASGLQPDPEYLAATVITRVFQ